MATKLKSLAILIVGLGLAYWFARGIDWATVGAYWKAANVWLLLLGALFINLTMLVRAVRWATFLQPITRVNLGDALAATVIGFGCIFIAGRAGDVVRPLLLSLRTRIKASATIATILIERIYDMTAVAVMFAVNLLLIELPASKADDLQQMRSVGLLMLVGLGLGITLLVILRLRTQWLIQVLGKMFRWLPRRLLDFMIGLLTHLADGLSVLLNARELLKTITQTAIVWGLIAIAYWFVVQAFGIRFSLSQAIFVLGAGLVGSLIPTPGGSAGAFHAAAQKGLVFLDVETNLAAATAIAIHIISFGSPFLFALFYLMRTNISFGQLRSLMAGEEERDRIKSEKLADHPTTGVES
ncbi:MAG: flippase-like domain-containing protein [Blastocatellia bacterium]|nr:flippase-like domain-containing protein [Blastocatellia bacterium]